MITTIPLETKTRDRLKSLGKKGETYDQILGRLILLAEYEEFMEMRYARLEEVLKEPPAVKITLEEFHGFRRELSQKAES